MAPAADKAVVDQITMGLGYTAVTTTDGRLGLAYTYFAHKTDCTMAGPYRDFEGRPATELLACIRSNQPLARTKGLALVNALIDGQWHDQPADANNDGLCTMLDIQHGSRVAMVGYIKPVAKLLKERGAVVEVIDTFLEIGDAHAFHAILSQWADTAVITSSAILNNTLESILDCLKPDAKAAIMGPGTPLAPQLFQHWPAVSVLAGIVPTETAAILKAVRHGQGTPVLHRFSRKVTITTQVPS